MPWPVLQLATVLVVAWTIWVAIGVKNGTIYATGVPTFRDKEPVAFWCIFAVHLLVIGGFAAALVFIWRDSDLPGWW